MLSRRVKFSRRSSDEASGKTDGANHPVLTDGVVGQTEGILSLIPDRVASVAAAMYYVFMVNKFPTHCVTCGEKKDAGHGQVSKVRGRWVCNCSPRVVRSGDTGEAYDAIKDDMLVNGYYKGSR